MLVRATHVIDILSAIIFLKYSYSERPRVKVDDLWLFMVEIIYLELVDLVLESFVLSMGSYFILFGYLQLEYRRSTRTNVLHILLYIILGGLLQLFLAMFFIWLEMTILQEVVVLVINIVGCVLFFILGKCHIIYRISNSILRDEHVIKIIFIIIACTVVYLLFLYKNDEFFRSTDFLFFGIWSILICFLTVQWQRTKLESLAKDRELEVREIYETKYQELLDSVRKRQHDFDNQLNALSGQYLYAESLEELIERQQEYSVCIRQENRYNKLIVKGAGSPILTGFLFTKAMEAENRGCTVSYEVSYSTLHCELPVYQMIDVFGVLLDNAIEALEQYVGEKHLHFLVKEYLDRIECGVYNVSPYVPAESIHEMVEREVSTKGAGRGIGLPKVIEMLNEIDVDLYIINKTMFEKNYLAFEFQIKK